MLAWYYFLDPALVIIMCIVCFIAFRKLVSRKVLMIFVLILLWLGAFTGFIINEYYVLNDLVTVTALNEAGKGSGVSVALKEDKKDTGFYFVQGQWPYDETNGYYFWVPQGDAYHQEGMTQSISFNVKIAENRKLIFSGSPWCGKIRIEYGNVSKIVDTYSSSEFSDISVDIPSTPQNIRNAAVNQFVRFAIAYIILSSIVLIAVFLVIRKNSFGKLMKYKFLFNELIKRDFTLKYKRTILGMVWSIISPLLNLLIMWLVFNQILGNNVHHFVIYLFAGQLVFSYFSDATNLGMSSLLDNAGIFTKVNVPKYMFLFSRNISSLINFGITLLIFFVFVGFEGLPFTSKYLMLVYPVLCMIIFNVGVGLILSALFVFFRDMQYLWGIFTQLLMWTSAIFYTIDDFSESVRNIFLLNPIYLYIRYFRKIVIESTVPSVWFHLLAAAYALIAFGIGSWLYKKYNHEFLYYV